MYIYQVDVSNNVFQSIHSHVFNLNLQKKLQIAKKFSQTTSTIIENLNNVYVFKHNKLQLLQETKMSYLSCYLIMDIYERSRRLT